MSAQTQPGQPVAPDAASQAPAVAVPASASASAAVPSSPVSAAAPDPYILEDGGFSIEPIYWLNRAQPLLRSGKSATAVGEYDFTGAANYSLGGEISLPAGPQNSLRISYFRVQGNSNNTLTAANTYFSEAYTAGDYLTAGYRLQSAKVSWDYLSYNWDKKPGRLRLKTLYEIQYVTISSTMAAPFKAVTTDSSGNTDYNTAQGSKNLFLPSFGLKLEQSLGHHLRWETQGSGFAIPHHATLWDAQGAFAVRAGDVELLLGGRAFHFKNSPEGAEFFTDTLSGAYVGVRYYWGGLKW